MQQERKEISGKANTIAGFSIPLYLGILALVVVCMYMDCLPAGLVGGMIALMVLGEGLNFLGNHTPVVKTYLGGSVICILGAAVIQALGLIPEQTHEILDNFVNKEGFLVFYISALITGSLFNIDRGLLIRATVKLLPTAVISLAVGVILSGLLGMVMGDRYSDDERRHDGGSSASVGNVFVGSGDGRRTDPDADRTGDGAGKLRGDHFWRFSQ